MLGRQNRASIGIWQHKSRPRPGWVPTSWQSGRCSGHRPMEYSGHGEREVTEWLIGDMSDEDLDRSRPSSFPVLAAWFGYQRLRVFTSRVGSHLLPLNGIAKKPPGIRILNRQIDDQALVALKESSSTRADCPLRRARSEEPESRGDQTAGAWSSRAGACAHQDCIGRTRRGRSSRSADQRRLLRACLASPYSRRGGDHEGGEMGSVFATRTCVAAVTIRLKASISVVNTAGTLDRRGAGLCCAARRPREPLGNGGTGTWGTTGWAPVRDAVRRRPSRGAGRCGGSPERPLPARRG